MSDFIDYYLTSASPYAYLGHKVLVSIAERHGKIVNFKPFDISKVWANSGAVPLSERPAVRKRYRLLELQRNALMRGTCINIKPKHFPTDPTLADLCVCAINLSDGEPAMFIQAVGRALWEQERRIDDEAVIRELLTQCDHEPDQIFALAKTSEASEMREQNSKDAIAADAVGAPSYVYKGEVFWGQDRLEQLDQMISSRRDAFSAEV